MCTECWGLAYLGAPHPRRPLQLEAVTGTWPTGDGEVGTADAAFLLSLPQGLREASARFRGQAPCPQGEGLDTQNGEADRYLTAAAAAELTTFIELPHVPVTVTNTLHTLCKFSKIQQCMYVKYLLPVFPGRLYLLSPYFFI